MPENTDGTVVVAVADKVARAGPAYAAQEARRLGARIRVVHVVPAPNFAGVPAPMVIEGDTLRRAGADVVDEVTTTLAHEVPEAVVLPTVRYGPTVPELVRSARNARSIVVERRPRGWRRVVTLSTANGVAAHAPTPVVVVPGEWTPDAARERLVVVGVDDALTAPHLIDAAFAEARQRGGRLRIVHAWHYNDAYDDLVFEGEAAQTHGEELCAKLELDLGPALRRHADVSTEIVVRHARPADLLTLEAESAGLLVLGRHRPLVSWGPHLGAVVRAVLRESGCPVMVVDAALSRPEPEPAG